MKKSFANPSDSFFMDMAKIGSNALINIKKKIRTNGSVIASLHFWAKNISEAEVWFWKGQVYEKCIDIVSENH